MDAVQRFTISCQLYPCNDLRFDHSESGCNPRRRSALGVARVPRPQCKASARQELHSLLAGNGGAMRLLLKQLTDCVRAHPSFET